MPGGTVGDVLTWRRDQDRLTEDAGRELLHRGGRGATTDEQHLIDGHPLGDQRLDSVGQPAQQALHGGPAPVRRVDVRRVRPWTAPVARGRLGVRSLEVGGRTSPPAPDGADSARSDSIAWSTPSRVAASSTRAALRVDQREAVARRVGEPGHCPGDIGDRRRRDPGDDPGGADRDDDVPWRAASPSAAAALSPVPGPSTAVAARTPTGSAGPATRGTAGRRPRRASSSRSARYSPVRADQ